MFHCVATWEHSVTRGPRGPTYSLGGRAGRYRAGPGGLGAWGACGVWGAPVVWRRGRTGRHGSAAAAGNPPHTSPSRRSGGRRDNRTSGDKSSRTRTDKSVNAE